MPAIPAPRRRLVGALEHHQRELALADVRGRNERQPVPGRAEHEVERARGRAARRPAAPGRRRAPPRGSSPRAAAVRRPARRARRRPSRGRSRRRAVRAGAQRELLGDLVDAVDVEDRLVGLEQPPDARLVDLHLRAADGQRAEHAACRRAPRSRPARSVPSIPSGSAALKSASTSIESILAPHRLGQQLDARRAGGEHERGAVERALELVVVRGLGDVEAALLGGGRARARGGTPAAEAVGCGMPETVTSQPSSIEELGRAQADRARADDHDAAPFEVDLAREPRDGRRRGRVAAVGVEHDRHVERAEERLLDLGSSTSSPAPTLEPPTHTATGRGRRARG